MTSCFFAGRERRLVNLPVAGTHLLLATAHKVVSHALCPVFIFRAAAAEARRNSASA